MLAKFRERLKAGTDEPLVLLSVLLALLGVWILLPEILLGGSPMSADKAVQFSKSRMAPLRAVTAARIALIRGDLWADAVEIFERRAQASATGLDNETSAGAKEQLSIACRNALSLAPISPRLWALCAPYCSGHMHFDCVTQYIQMAYFTGPFILESIPNRLRTAMTIDFGRSPDIKILVTEDIRLILRQEPALKPDLMSSYRHAFAGNRPAILAQIKDIDPAFAATLR